MNKPTEQLRWTCRYLASCHVYLIEDEEGRRVAVDDARFRAVKKALAVAAQRGNPVRIVEVQ